MGTSPNAFQLHTLPLGSSSASAPTFGDDDAAPAVALQAVDWQQLQQTEQPEQPFPPPDCVRATESNASDQNSDSGDQNRSLSVATTVSNRARRVDERTEDRSPSPPAKYPVPEPEILLPEEQNHFNYGIYPDLFNPDDDGPFFRDPSGILWNGVKPTAIPTMSSVQQQKRAVDQLRREAGIRRIPVSQAAEDLKVSRTFSVFPHNLIAFRPLTAFYPGSRTRGLPAGRIPLTKSESIPRKELLSPPLRLIYRCIFLATHDTTQLKRPKFRFSVTI